MLFTQQYHSEQKKSADFTKIKFPGILKLHRADAICTKVEHATRTNSNKQDQQLQLGLSAVPVLNVRFLDSSEV